MDKTKLKRHDLLYPTQQGRNNVWCMVQENFSDAIAIVSKEVFAGKIVIPGIVRREPISDDELVAVGFVSPQLYDEQRIRIAGFLKLSEITVVERPYEVYERSFVTRTRCLEVAAVIKEYAKQYGLKIGVLGSAALEIATGLAFTNAESDLDLLLQGSTYANLQKVYPSMKRIADQYGVALDIEVELTNGYGVKAAELFMPTQTVLGKSLVDVQILEKEAVLKALA